MALHKEDKDKHQVDIYIFIILRILTNNLNIS